MIASVRCANGIRNSKGGGIGEQCAVGSEVARAAGRHGVSGSIPVLFAITIALNVAGQYLLKAGTGKVTLALSHWVAIVTNPELLLGLAAYVVSLATWLLLLKRLPLAVAYPTLSLSYILIVLVGVVVLREPWSWTRVAGSAVIVLGVWLLWRPA